MGHPSDGPNGAVELDMEMDEIAGIGWALRETMGNHGKPMQICATSGGPTRTGMEPMKLAMGKKGNTHGDAHGNSMEIHAPKIVPGWIGSITPHKTRNLDRNLDLQMQMVPDLERVEKCPGR